MITMNSIIKAHGYIEILDNFLITSIENWLGYNEVIYQDNNVSCYRAKRIKVLSSKKA